jgi:hypothetical protein
MSYVRVAGHQFRPGKKLKFWFGRFNIAGLDGLDPGDPPVVNVFFALAANIALE